MEGHVIICGLGHVGYRCFGLLKRLGVSVAVIYDRSDGDWLAEIERAGGACLQGDARDSRLLVQAGIAKARAVIVVTDSDITNLAAALDAKSLNPAVEIVVRLFDQNLAPHLVESLGFRSVLSTSAIAAPVFIAAASEPEIVHYLKLESSQLVFVEETREVSEAIFVTPTHAGLVLKELPSAQAAGRPARLRPSVFSQLRAFFKSVPAALKVLFLLLLSVAAFSVVLFELQLGLSAVDSLYFTTTILTTVGFGDLNFSSATPLMKLYGSFLMICGAALLAMLISVCGDFLLSLRLKELFTRRAVPRSGHYILVGLGTIGARIAEQLRSQAQEVVLADNSGRAVAERAIGEDTPVVEGDPRAAEVLKLLNVNQAKGLIAVSDDDLFNLGVGLAAKKINPRIVTVVRTFDSSLAAKLKGQLEIDSILSVSAVSAPAFVAAALYPGVVDAFLWRDSLIVARHIERSEQKELPVKNDELKDGELQVLTLGSGKALTLNRIALNP